MDQDRVETETTVDDDVRDHVYGAVSEIANEEADSGYQLPPQALVDIIDRPPTPRVRVSP